MGCGPPRFNGPHLLQGGRTDEALALATLNLEYFPESVSTLMLIAQTKRMRETSRASGCWLSPGGRFGCRWTPVIAGPVHADPPGSLLHMDIKKLARIARVGHRIHGDRSGKAEGVGWEFHHAAISAWLCRYNLTRCHAGIGRKTPFQRLVELRVTNVLATYNSSSAVDGDCLRCRLTDIDLDVLRLRISLPQDEDGDKCGDQERDDQERPLICRSTFVQHGCLSLLM